METIFWICVRIMVVASHAIGISYQQLNVLLFVIIHPALTIALMYFCLQYRKKYIAAMKLR